MDGAAVRGRARGAAAARRTGARRSRWRRCWRRCARQAGPRRPAAPVRAAGCRRGQGIRGPAGGQAGARARGPARRPGDHPRTRGRSRRADRPGRRCALQTPGGHRGPPGGGGSIGAEAGPRGRSWSTALHACGPAADAIIDCAIARRARAPAAGALLHRPCRGWHAPAASHGRTRWAFPARRPCAAGSCRRSSTPSGPCGWRPPAGRPRWSSCARPR